MSESAFGLVEQGISVAQRRAAVLAADAANARTPGFVARDLAVEPGTFGRGPRFASVVAAAGGAGGTIEYTMVATADNAVRFRALADQERAMLREYRTVAEEARR